MNFWLFFVVNQTVRSYLSEFKMIVLNSISIFRQATVNNGLSLKSLAADLLNVSLDKSLELRCSDWEADQLTLEQVVIHLTTGFLTFFILLIFTSTTVNKSTKQRWYLMGGFILGVPGSRINFLYRQ